MDLQKKHWSTFLPTVLHMGFWLLFASIVVFLRPPVPNTSDLNVWPPLVSIFLLQLPFFYLNAYFLIPRFLYRNGGILYFFLALGAGIVISALHYFLRVTFDLHPPNFPIRWHLIDMPVLLMWAISTSYRLLMDNLRKEQERKEQETERLKSELSFLRSQISPHFMFNVLNSIAALARKKSDKVEPVVIQLSELMRYMLYASDESLVPLNKEISYLQNYVDLQRLRFGSTVSIHFSAENTDSSLLIEPMLLIPFVENAFKHGTGLIAEPSIEIYASSQGESFRFQVRNKADRQSTEEKDRNSGIGLANIERRLKLLYPDSYQLQINQTRDWYEVDLTIQLKKGANKPITQPSLSIQ